MAARIATTCGRLAVLALFALLSTSRPAVANVPVFTKTCVDQNGGQLCEGDWVRCTLHVEISGSQEIFTITDQIPGSFYTLWRSVVNPPAGNPAHLLENTPMTAAQNGRYSYTRVTMNPGAQFDFVYEAQVRAVPVGTTICRTASIRTANLEDYASNESCLTYTCLPPNTPNTQANKRWLGPAPVTVGTAVQFVIELSNTGTAADSNVRLQDTLDAVRFMVPTNVAFSRAPDAGGWAGGLTIDATWNTLAVGETITITIDTVYANCNGNGQDGACNQATLTATSIPGTRSSNNPDTGALNDPTCRQAIAGGFAAITTPPVKEMIDVNGPPLQVNDLVRIRVTFENTAFCPATQGFFRDTLPAELTYTANSTVVTPDSGTKSFDNPTNQVRVDNFVVGGNDSTTIEFETRLNALPGGGQLCNTAQYFFGVSNPIDTTQACLGGPADQLAASKSVNDPNGNGTVYPGQTLDFTITVLNNGPNTVGSATITDTVPSCFEVVQVTAPPGGSATVAGNQVTITQVSVPTGATPVTAIIQVRENGTCDFGTRSCNTASVNSPGSPAPVTTNQACVTVADPLTIAKAHSNPNGNGAVTRGQSFDYTISIANAGPAAVGPVSLADVVPACFDVIQVTAPPGAVVNQVGNSVDVTGISVAAGAGSTDVVIRVTENGSCADADRPCNRADIDHPQMPAPRVTNDACISIATAPACPQTPQAIKPLKGIKVLPTTARWDWPTEASSGSGYRVYSVLVKTELDRTVPTAGARGSNPNATLQCSTASQPLVTCDDADAFGGGQPDKLFYEVVGVCADGSEGLN